MKKISKVMLITMVLFFLISSQAGITIAKASGLNPEIVFVGIEHSPLVVGDTQTFTIVTSNADKVQYKILLKPVSSKSWEDITGGYTNAVDGQTPYIITPTKFFELGKYTLRIYAKRTADGEETYYDVGVNCVSRDDKNRVYSNGDVLIDKTDYKLAETVTVKGITGLSGIQGPYKLRLHVYNVTKNKWINNVQANYGDNITWTPTEVGVYVLDIHINTPNSTTWNTYLNNLGSGILKGTYEGWKLKVITVSPADTVESGSVSEEIKNVVLKNIEALSNNNIDDYMSCISPEDSQLYESTKQAVSTIIQYYKFDVKIEDIKVLSTSEDDAQVSITITIKKISGPDYKDNRNTTIHHLKKVNGKWYIYGSEVKSFEALN